MTSSQLQAGITGVATDCGPKGQCTACRGSRPASKLTQRLRIGIGLHSDCRSPSPPGSRVASRCAPSPADHCWVGHRRRAAAPGNAEPRAALRCTGLRRSSSRCSRSDRRSASAAGGKVGAKQAQRGQEHQPGLLHHHVPADDRALGRQRILQDFCKSSKHSLPTQARASPGSLWSS